MPHVNVKWHWKWFWWVVVIGLAIWYFGYYRPAHKQPPPAPPVLTKVLIPRFEGMTPCDPTFDYTFELDTQGSPVILTLPGVHGPVTLEYSGKGQIDLDDPRHPIKRLAGPVHIISADPSKQAWVQISEIQYIYKGHPERR
ncbi:MAG: hypothetical protein WC870_02230 [Candidatus Paceibacterota bacterium]